MAKIKVESQSTGTGIYTLKTGAASTNYSATLPDATGTLINTAPSTSGNVLTSDGTNWTSAAAAGGDNTPSFRATLNSAQSIPNATHTLIQFNTEVWDTDTAYDNATNYRFTVPSGEAGKYMFTFMNRLQSMTDGSKADFFIRINGTADVEKASHAAMTQHLSGTVVAVVDLSVSDYVDCAIYQNSGSAKNLYAGANFTGFKLLGV